jgi:transposase
MEAYSMDLRKRVLARVDEGKLTRVEIASLFQVSTAWIRRLVQRRRETGSIEPKKGKPGPKPKLSEKQRQRLLVLVQGDPDATLAELRHRLRVSVCLATIWYALRELGLTYKKSRSEPASRIVPMWPASDKSSVVD